MKLIFRRFHLMKKTALMKRIEDYSYTGLHWKQGFQSAIFFIEDSFDISFLNVPAECRLSRLQ